MPTFNPPTRQEGSSDFFFGRYSIPVGQSVVKVNGVFTAQPYPWLGDLVNLTEGVDYFLGGHSYEIDNGLALNLEAAGFPVDNFAMRSWFTALGNRNHAPAKALIIGDSISEGVLAGSPSYQKRWIDLLQKQIRVRYDGSAGAPGFMPAYYADAIMADDTTRGGAAPTEQSWIWGPGGKALRIPGTTGSNGTLTWPSITCDQVRIWYGKTDFLGGNFKVLIDSVDVTSSGTLSTGGSSPANVNCSNATKVDGFYWQSAALSAGAHTVTVQSVTNGAGSIIDAAEFLYQDTARGVHVYDGAHSGATVFNYIQSSMDPAWQAVTTIAPHVIIVNLGTNDINAGNPNPVSLYKSQVQALITKAQSVAPAAVIVLTKGYKPGAYDDYMWSQFMAQLDILAATNTNVVTFNLAGKWPTLTADGRNSQGLMYEAPNPVHPNTAGHQKYADVMTDFLAPLNPPAGFTIP